MSSSRLIVFALSAAALTFPAAVEASPGPAVAGLQVKPRVLAYGGIEIGSCDLRTYAGCGIKTISLRNVGSETIFIGGYGIAVDPGPTNAALFLGDATECSSLPLIDGYWALEPRASCTISVAFAADTKGVVEAEVHVWHTDQFSPIAVVPLTGVGI